MKNWALAECGSEVRAMAMLPRAFFRPLSASFSIGVARRLLLHAGLEAAALDHEAVDDAMEDGVVVMAGLDVGDEVLDRLGRLLGVEFQGDGAVVGVQFDHVTIPYLVSLSLTDSMTTGVVGTFWWPPALPVGTLAILLTTSMPWVTLPNTA